MILKIKVFWGYQTNLSVVTKSLIIGASFFKWGSYQECRLPNRSYPAGTKLLSFSWTKNQKWVKVVFWGGGLAALPSLGMSQLLRVNQPSDDFTHLRQRDNKRKSAPISGTMCPAANEYAADRIFRVGYQPCLLSRFFFFVFLCEYLPNRSNDMKYSRLLFFPHFIRNYKLGEAIFLLSYSLAILQLRSWEHLNACGQSEGA